jgi:hypothetical protein
LSILSKRIVDITDEEKRAAAKPLGTSQRPYPMRLKEERIDERGRQVMITRLGAIRSDSDPMLVYSDRPYSEVMGILLRDMPVPSMLEMMRDGFHMRRPGNKRTIMYYVGAPGMGKTFLSDMEARVRDKKGAIKIDCGKKNLGELLFEPVLDFGKDRRFYDEFDKRLQMYNDAKTPEARDRIFHPHSIAILKSHLGTALSYEDGRYAIDWAATGECLGGENNKLDSRQTLNIVSEGLLSVAKKEGFGHMASNNLGIATQEGPLIRAWKEGRELILDEFNRAKEGTTASLHTVLQFLAGEIDSVVVENTLKEKGEEGQFYTFRREDQRLGFFVSATGNSEEDGGDVYAMPQSVASRVVPKFIPVATVEDWQHRICQTMTGLPVSTLYRASEADWKKDPELFRQKLAEWRTLGMSEDEAVNVPDLHMKLLRRWEDVMDASEKLAKFYYSWSQVVNPDSPMHRSGSLAQLMEEIDELYSAKVSIDFRKVILHINEALERVPSATSGDLSHGIDGSDWNKAPAIVAAKEKEDPSRHFGTRLASTILNHVSGTTIEMGKTNLYRQIMQIATDCGLATPMLQEGKPSTRRTIAGLLDENPYASEVPEVKAQLLRDMMCDYLREQDPRLSKDNNELMSVRNVREALAALAAAKTPSAPDIGKENEPQAVAERTIAVFNDDLDTVQAQPIITAPLRDAVDVLTAAEGEAVTPSAGQLLSRDAVLYGIATPALRAGNLTAIWNDALSRAGLAHDASESNVADSLAIAENRSKTSLAVTTLMVANQNGKTAQALHIVWNNAHDRVLIVGEGSLPRQVRASFANTRVQYVDRNDRNAVNKAEVALNAVVGNGLADEKLADRLKTAFLMRNGLDSIAEQEKTGLAELLVRRDVKTFLPNYAVKPA